METSLNTIIIGLDAEACITSLGTGVSANKLPAPKSLNWWNVRTRLETLLENDDFHCQSEYGHWIAWIAPKLYAVDSVERADCNRLQSIALEQTYGLVVWILLLDWISLLDSSSV